jgi:long-chain fatty acid transport protein
VNRFLMRRFIIILCTSGLLTISNLAIASGFQLFEQDAASVGNYHAGYAAEANDASTAWYNPAGIPRIKNQQVVTGTSLILTDFKYKGSLGITEQSVNLDTANIEPATVTFNGVTAQGGTFNVVPFLNYVAPINDQIGFGFSVVAPFGLKTNYGSSTNVRYAATKTAVTVVDISPSLGIRFTDKVSAGLGLDVQRASADFNSIAGLIDPFSDPKVVLTSNDTLSLNNAHSTGYGLHFGVLYEFTPCTRLGVSYHSQVVHNLLGTSKFIGPIATLINTNNADNIESSAAKARITLPPYTAISGFTKLNPSWALMGTITYTQWNVFQQLSLSNVAGAVNSNDEDLLAASTNIHITVPQHFHNTYSASLGANYYPSDTIILRTGIGYDETPVRDAYRSVPLPDSNRYIFALGGHFQASKTLGFDVGWSHIFFNGNVKVNPPPQVNGAEIVSANGSVKGGADVFSGQIVWDMV